MKVAMRRHELRIVGLALTAILAGTGCNLSATHPTVIPSSSKLDGVDVAAVTTSGPERLFSHYFPHPSDNNGMEEYLRCYDSLQDPELIKLDDLARSLAKKASSRTEFESIREKELLLGDKILGLVAKGNSKPVMMPQHTDWEAKDFWGGYEAIDRVACQAASAHFRAHEPNRAIDILITQLTFADKIGRLGTISLADTQMIDKRIVATIEMNREQLTREDWQRIINVCHDRLSKPSPLVNALNADRPYFASLIRASAPPTDGWGIEPSPTDRLNIEREFSDTQASASNQIDGLIEASNKPMSQWPWPGDSGLNAPKTSAEISATNAVNGSSLLVTAAAINLRIRMLVLAAKVELYRKHFGHFPVAIGELKTPAESVDPLTGGSFRYRRSRDGSQYSIWSRGKGKFSPIQLNPGLRSAR